MSVYERSEKKSHLETVWYEIAMLQFCYSELQKCKDLSGSVPARNLLIEGALLHYRNVLEFCSGAKHRAARNGKPADISTADAKVWAGRKLTAEELEKIQQPATALEMKYFDDISQFLQHCTERRFIDSKAWDLDAMMNEVTPIVAALREAFPPKLLLESRTDALRQRRDVLSGSNSATTASFSVVGMLGVFSFEKPDK